MEGCRGCRIDLSKLNDIEIWEMEKKTPPGDKPARKPKKKTQKKMKAKRTKKKKSRGSGGGVPQGTTQDHPSNPGDRTGLG
jgi:hypothetical protein